MHTQGVALFIKASSLKFLILSQFTPAGYNHNSLTYISAVSNDFTLSIIVNYKLNLIDAVLHSFSYYFLRQQPTTFFIKNSWLGILFLLSS